MKKKKKIAIVATAVAATVATTAVVVETNSEDMSKLSLIEKLKALAGKGGRAVMPEMAMCYEMPAQPSEYFQCPVCGDSITVWGYDMDNIQYYVDQIVADGFDLKVERRCAKCTVGLEEGQPNYIVYVVLYKAKGAKEYHEGYAEKSEDFNMLRAVLNGAKETYRSIYTTDEPIDWEKIKQMIGEQPK